MRAHPTALGRIQVMSITIVVRPKQDLGRASLMAERRPASRTEFAKFKGARWNGMNDICALSRTEDLTPVQRVAHLAYWYMSEVYNGARKRADIEIGRAHV